jgi:hypothetical protein
MIARGNRDTNSLLANDNPVSVCGRLAASAEATRSKRPGTYEERCQWTRSHAKEISLPSMTSQRKCRWRNTPNR